MSAVVPVHPDGRLIHTVDGELIREKHYHESTTYNYSKKSLAERTRYRDNLARVRIERAMDMKMFVCKSCRQDKPTLELSQNQLKLMQMRYDKIRPNLQAIDAFITTHEETADPRELMAQAASALSDNPQTLVEVLRNDLQAAKAVLEALEVLRPLVYPKQIQSVDNCETVDDTSQVVDK